MLFSELYKIMVKRVTFVGFRGGDRPNRRSWIRPWLEEQNRYGLVRDFMINLPESPINDEVGNDAHIASTGVRLHYRTPRVATTKHETGN